MNEHFRNAYPHPLTIAEQIAHGQRGAAMTAQATQHIGRVRAAIEAQTITERTGIPLDAITPTDRWEYAMGSTEEGASEYWPRWPFRALRPAPEAEWPAPLPSLLTEGHDDDPA